MLSWRTKVLHGTEGCQQKCGMNRQLGLFWVGSVASCRDQGRAGGSPTKVTPCRLGIDRVQAL